MKLIVLMKVIDEGYGAMRHAERKNGHFSSTATHQQRYVRTMLRGLLHDECGLTEKPQR
jgi:hypothetical protein